MEQLNKTINALKNSITDLKQQIDYVKFNCLGIVEYTVMTLNGSITYQFGTSIFSSYVTNQYGIPSNALQNIIGPLSTVTLTPVSIFNTQWASSFG